MPPQLLSGNRPPWSSATHCFVSFAPAPQRLITLVRGTDWEKGKCLAGLTVLTLEAVAAVFAVLRGAGTACEQAGRSDGTTREWWALLQEQRVCYGRNSKEEARQRTERGQQRGREGVVLGGGGGRTSAK